MSLAKVRYSFAAAFFPRRSEWACAALTVLLGWVLWTNPDLMRPDPELVAAGKGKSYDLMLLIAEQATWARIFISFGAVRLIVLLINGAWRRSPHLRAVTAFLSCAFWTQIMLSFAPVFGFAFSMAMVFLALEMSNVFVAMRDARTVDDAMQREHKHGRLGQ